MAKVKKYEIKYNSNHYTVIANDIIRGKQSMSLQTARLIRLLITQLVKEDKDLKTYMCKISDLAEFLNIPKNNLYRDIRSICDCAMKSVVYIGTGNPKQSWKMFHWLSTAEYDGNGIITLRLSDEIKPYILELENWFTQYKLKNILEFNSFYAIRMYELIKCQEGISRDEKEYHEFTIEYLREYFDCEKKYSKISQFKEKVIEIAVKEMNKKSDMFINIEYIKTGRAITSVRFFVHPNYNKYQNK